MLWHALLLTWMISWEIRLERLRIAPFQLCMDCFLPRAIFVCVVGLDLERISRFKRVRNDVALTRRHLGEWSEGGANLVRKGEDQLGRGCFLNEEIQSIFLTDVGVAY